MPSHIGGGVKKRFDLNNDYYFYYTDQVTVAFRNGTDGLRHVYTMFPDIRFPDIPNPTTGLFFPWSR